MAEARSTEITEQELADLTDVLEAAEIFVAVDVRDGALILSGEVDSEEMHGAAIDLASIVAERHGQRIEDAIDVLDVELDLGPGERADIDPEDAPPPDADTVDDVGTVDFKIATEEGIPYFPPTDPVIGEQYVEQDEVEVIGGFEPTSEDHDEDEVDRVHLLDDERITTDVLRELRQDATTTELDIQVGTLKRVVYLRGVVPTLEDAENVQAVAARVPGVEDVEDELTIPALEADQEQ